MISCPGLVVVLADNNNGLAGGSIAGGYSTAAWFETRCVASLCLLIMAELDPAIHDFLIASNRNVDARVKPGHDDCEDC